MKQANRSQPIEMAPRSPPRQQVPDGKARSDLHRRPDVGARACSAHLRSHRGGAFAVPSSCANLMPCNLRHPHGYRPAAHVGVICSRSEPSCCTSQQRVLVPQCRNGYDHLRLHAAHRSPYLHAPTVSANRTVHAIGGRRYRVGPPAWS